MSCLKREGGQNSVFIPHASYILGNDGTKGKHLNELPLDLILRVLSCISVETQVPTNEC